mgnify:CR=1 FL=1
MKIIIGVATYGTFLRINRFIRSYWANTEKSDKHELIHVCCDDGTSDLSAVREREKFCKLWNFNFVCNEKRSGIVPTWNRLANFIPDAELIILAPDDCLFLGPGWLSRIIYFSQENTASAFCLSFVENNRLNDGDSRWQQPPYPLLPGYPVSLFATKINRFPQTNNDSWVLPWPPCGGDRPMDLFSEVLANDRVETLTAGKIRWLDKSGNPQEKLIEEIS